MIDSARLASSLMATMREWIEPAMTAVGERLDDLDAKFKAIPPARDGRDADPEQVAALVLSRIPTPKDGKDGGQGPAGKDAEPIHPDTIVRMVSEAAPVLIEKLVQAAVTTATASLPAPKDGQPGKDGVSPDPREIAAIVLEQMPKPEDESDEFAEFADELLRGLDEFRTEMAAPVIQKSRQGGPGVREVMTRMAGIERLLLAPIVPQYDDKGKLIGAKRIEAS